MGRGFYFRIFQEVKVASGFSKGSVALEAFSMGTQIQQMVKSEREFYEV